MAVTINADNGVSSGSAGLKQTADSTGVLALQTNGTTAVTVDTSQNVGIGTSSPSSKLDVVGGNIRSYVAANNGAFICDGSATGNPYYGFSQAGTLQAYIQLQGSGSSTSLNFANQGSVRAIIDSSGNVGIGTSSPSSKLNLADSSNSGFVSTLTFSANNSLSAKTDYVQFKPSVELNTSGGEAGGYTLQIKQQGSYKNSIVASGITNNSGNYLAFSTTNEAMRIDSSGNLLVNTTTAQTGAKLAVTGGIQGTIQSGTAVNSTSGTSISFTSIPSWVKRITVMLNGVSTNGTSFLIIQLGTGATPTYTTSGYVSGSVNTTATTGMLIWGGSAADIRVGSCVLTNFGNNIWNSMAAGGYANGAGGANAGGYVSLGATLTAVRITTINGTDTFDAGSINILYEG